MLIDYLNTYPNTKSWYYAGKMSLKVYSDTAYLVLPNACICIAGNFYLESTTETEQSIRR